MAFKTHVLTCGLTENTQEQIYNFTTTITKNTTLLPGDALKQCDSVRLILYSNAYNLDVL